MGKPTSFQQGGSIGLSHTSKIGEHLHEVACVSSAQDLLAEVTTGGRIKGTALGKYISDIDGKHLGPQITVVTGGIASTPNMVEITGAIAWRNLFVKQANLLKSLNLKGSSLIS